MRSEARRALEMAMVLVCILGLRRKMLDVFIGGKKGRGAAMKREDGTFQTCHCITRREGGREGGIN